MTILTIGAYLLATSNSITYVTSDTVSGVVLMLIVGFALSGVAVIGVISSALSWKPLIIIVSDILAQFHVSNHSSIIIVTNTVCTIQYT